MPKSHSLVKYGLIGIAIVALFVLANAYFKGHDESNNIHVVDVRLPPPKSTQQSELELLMSKRGLSMDEMAQLREYKIERASLWTEQPMVSEIVEGISSGKEMHLRNELANRNLSPKEVELFIEDLKKDLPEILVD